MTTEQIIEALRMLAIGRHGCEQVQKLAEYLSAKPKPVAAKEVAKEAAK